MGDIQPIRHDAKIPVSDLNEIVKASNQVKNLTTDGIIQVQRTSNAIGLSINLGVLIPKLPKTTAPTGTSTNPKALASSGATANTDSYDITAPGVDGSSNPYYGCSYVPFRLYWDGTIGHDVYEFTRTVTVDSLGNLVTVTVETRSTAFGTGNC